MPKYRKKPVVIAPIQIDPEIIEAVQFDPQQKPWPDGVISWSDAGYQPRDMSWGYIQTLQGRAHIQNGDWIVTGSSGEKYLRKPDFFQASYELAEEE